ncbi:thiamine pyridinylase [Aquimarina sp. RZ0]|uniref:thiamine pyridinylase n=1 Tax=Aquimarina sp. RZ0 TaxID=2607730 RepID=UPI0011F1304C|nr:thiamine pyridinylase [Aquimarina sp. RZ0]KAA1244297.1 thiamine pyridinylase [Aquimarina sp. RZ0]
MPFRLLKLTLITLWFIGCSTMKNVSKSSDIIKTDEIPEINVALYPYLFEEYENKSKSILTSLWKAKHPNVKLNFVKYNSYKEAPPTKVDVFVMDALYISSFAEKKWILPIGEKHIENKSDLLPHSLEGCFYDGQCFGIPQFGCANILYYRNEDKEIRDCNTLEDLYKIIGKANYDSEKPPNETGLLIDLSSGTSNICFYIEAFMDKTGVYSANPKLALPYSLDKESLSNVKKLVDMGGEKSRDWLPKRAEWFSNGSGRCYVGFTENMFQMEQTNLENISMKLIPSYIDSNVDLFFMDAAVINANVGKSTKKRELAIALVNLISSTEHMVKSCQNGNNAFYYMPARKSIFETLKTQYPKYSEMFELIKISKPKTFRLGKEAFDKINYKDLMETVIFN